MSTMAVTTRVTHSYLMNKSKHDLALMVLDALDQADELRSQLEGEQTQAVNKCDHKFVHLETKKTQASRPSIGFSSAVDWERTDIYFCEKCLEWKTTTRKWSWMEYQDQAPAGW